MCHCLEYCVPSPSHTIAAARKLGWSGGGRLEASFQNPYLDTVSGSSLLQERGCPAGSPLLTEDFFCAYGRVYKDQFNDADEPAVVCLGAIGYVGQGCAAYVLFTQFED